MSGGSLLSSHLFLLLTFSGKFGMSYKQLFPLTFKTVNLN